MNAELNFEVTYFVSCGCGIECDENDSHCPVCKDPIAPVLEVNA